MKQSGYFVSSNRSVLKVYFRIGAIAGNHWVMGILLRLVHSEQAISENLFEVTCCPSKAIGQFQMHHWGQAQLTPIGSVAVGAVLYYYVQY